MSYSSVYTSTSTIDATATNIISANVGAEVLKTSASSGGNLPVAPATLVSGTTYNFINTPFPYGAGIYGIEINFDITGADDTEFSYIKTINSLVGVGVINDNSYLVGATLPDATTISFSTTTLYQLSSNPTPSQFLITFTPVFVGTAPTITSAYIKWFKLT